MRSETSDDVAKDIQEAQPTQSEKPTSEDTLKKVEDFLRELKKNDNLRGSKPVNELKKGAYTRLELLDTRAQ
ncbi:hypothetical protein H5410_021077 [Solanum commersonii]|uniref:Uncharacterized protein n=1 Tax=Solanum commersonii TaxID=4109 RepID=A0A9J5ZE54_SOLCO|nr:hypothetical protein H5410_021077 [Solanum commersonii]